MGGVEGMVRGEEGNGRGRGEGRGVGEEGGDRYKGELSGCACAGTDG